MVGKTWDTFAPIGPSIVTNVENVHNLGIKCILNNQIVQNSSTSQLIFKSVACTLTTSLFSSGKTDELHFSDRYLETW